jgi:hypothetical protein
MILTIGPGGCGFTFLCWSICFLRGDHDYQTLNNVKFPMIYNPLKGNIAHKFIKDHIQCVDDYHKLFFATDQSVIYFVPSHQKDFEFINQFGCKKILFDCREHNKEFFARMHNTVPECSYSSLLQSLSKQYDIDIIKQVLLESNHFFTKYYHIPEPDNEYYIIDFDQMFRTLDVAILDIFKFLQLQIDQDKYKHWQDIYAIYKEKNLNHLTQFLSQPVVVDSSTKLKIIKEIINWKNGSFQTI